MKFQCAYGVRHAAGVVLAAAVLAIAMSAEAGAKPQRPAVRSFCTRFQDLSAARSLPIKVLQCELQSDETGRRALVVYTEDPIPLLLDEQGIPTVKGTETAQKTVYGPLATYRDALRPVAKKLLPGVSQLLLAFRDDSGTVYAMKPGTMTRYLRGSLDDAAFADAIDISVAKT